MCLAGCRFMRYFKSNDTDTIAGNEYNYKELAKHEDYIKEFKITFNI